MAKRTLLPPRALLCRLLDYDPSTGALTWKPRAAGFSDDGYLIVRIGGARYYQHRIAWLMEKGPPVPEIIDHIDRNRSNNRIDNLRAATHGENMANQQRAKLGASGFQGVVIDRGRFRARITRRGRVVTIGSFDTAEEAAAAYRAAAER